MWSNGWLSVGGILNLTFWGKIILYEVFRVTRLRVDVMKFLRNLLLLRDSVWKGMNISYWIFGNLKLKMCFLTLWNLTAYKPILTYSIALSESIFSFRINFHYSKARNGQLSTSIKHNITKHIHNVTHSFTEHEKEKVGFFRKSVKRIIFYFACILKAIKTMSVC